MPGLDALMDSWIIC